MPTSSNQPTLPSQASKDQKKKRKRHNDAVLIQQKRRVTTRSSNTWAEKSFDDLLDHVLKDESATIEVQDHGLADPGSFTTTKTCADVRARFDGQGSCKMDDDPDYVEDEDKDDRDEYEYEDSSGQKCERIMASLGSLEQELFSQDHMNLHALLNLSPDKVYTAVDLEERRSPGARTAAPSPCS
ncbi:hypothetical protein MMC22_006465 [Lobaria immixta]|nr:hypothetical protein [Lobaria immixta]